jgi:glycosidase
LFVLFLGACCGQDPPRWSTPDVVALAAGESAEVELGPLVVSDQALTFVAEPGEGVDAAIDGGTLAITADEAYTGFTEVEVAARDECGNRATTRIVVEVEARPAVAGSCSITLSYASRSGDVQVAGSFSDWEPVELTDGALVLELEPGDYPYKFIDGGTWTCDPEQAWAQCDEGQAYDDACELGGNHCNSLLRVGECSRFELEYIALSGDQLTVLASAVEVDEPGATLDGAAVEGWSGGTFSLVATGLAPGRHVLALSGGDATPLTLPFWVDAPAIDEGILYFAFVDRFFDGDTSLDTEEGADVDYAGGDWAGVEQKLDYLDDLGVTALWLTAVVDNAEGPWAGDCGATYSGYHGYWPDSSALEEHFGDASALRSLVDAAHARNMRVIVDWVANHVHEDHAWVTEHPEWFNEEHICEEDDDDDGVDNWSQRPQTCWFASYLPDLDYTRTEPLVTTVDELVEVVREYQLDGLRVDAVKHMPESVLVDLVAGLRRAGLENDAFDLHLVGETFDGAETIASYLGDRELDGQFDFPLYWAIVQAFARDEIGLDDLAAQVAASEAAYGGAIMSPFLGNHDVERFVAQASGTTSSLYGDDPCADDGSPREPMAPPGWDEPYRRLILAWAFTLTQPGLPLVYYGDEIGLPGRADPDNRQVMRFDPDLSADEAAVLAAVTALGQARRAHPAFAHGTTTGWWENEAGFWGYARVEDDDAVLVLLNRDDADRTVQNGLAFAGLAQGTWTDVLTGDTVTSDGDSLTVDVPALGARVLVR